MDQVQLGSGKRCSFDTQAGEGRADVEDRLRAPGSVTIYHASHGGDSRMLTLYPRAVGNRSHCAHAVRASRRPGETRNQIERCRELEYSERVSVHECKNPNSRSESQVRAAYF